MKKFLITLTLLSSTMYFTQVGINTTNPQGTLHIDGAKDNPTSGVPSVAQQGNDLSFTTAGKLGIGTIIPRTKLDTRSNPGNSSPGEGPIAIGETSFGADGAGVGAGAIRYSTSSGGVLQYSNGLTWNTLSSNVQKSVIVASKTSSQNCTVGQSTIITNWSEEVDVNNNFNPSTGVFTVPRNGNYTISFSFTFENSQYPSGGYVEAWISASSSGTKLSTIGAPADNNFRYVGSIVSVTLKLVAGETVTARIYHLTGTDRQLRPGNFTNFSIAEL